MPLDDARNPWKVTASRVAYQNPWIRVREDQVIRPDGLPGIYGVVEIVPSIAVLAVDDEDRIVLVGQWRYTREHYSWEVPVGTAHPGETDMQVVAARELREETGVEASEWTHLGILEACIGVTTDTQWIYLAQKLRKLASTPDPDEQLQTRWLPFSQAVEEVLSGKITECASVASILKLELLRRSR